MKIKFITSQLITMYTYSLRLQAMVGFRNIAVHDYTNNLAIVQSIVENRLQDFRDYCEAIIKK